MLAPFTGHTSSVSSVSVINNFAVSGSWDHTVKSGIFLSSLNGVN